MIWEIRIKQGLGKLRLPPDFRQVLERQQALFRLKRYPREVKFLHK